MDAFSMILIICTVISLLCIFGLDQKNKEDKIKIQELEKQNNELATKIKIYESGLYTTKKLKNNNK